MAEFIFGNRDGKNRANDTYNVCRFHVPRKLFEAEKKAGFHGHTLEAMHVPTCCPARVQPNPKREVALTDKRAANIKQRPGEVIELIYEEFQTLDGRKPTPLPAKKKGKAKKAGNSLAADERLLTICRLGVPRPRMVEEVSLDLHPAYKVIRVAVAKTPGQPKIPYVQAIGNGTTRDNVNRVGRLWDCGAMCPISQLTAR